jgi:endonuclease YncB( thermonuclease family)
MVAEGLARVAKGADRVAAAAKAPGAPPPAAAAAELISRLREAQEAAHKGRIAMWRYGDCTSDDER